VAAGRCARMQRNGHWEVILYQPQDRQTVLYNTRDQTIHVVPLPASISPPTSPTPIHPSASRASPASSSSATAGSLDQVTRDDLASGTGSGDGATTRIDKHPAHVNVNVNATLRGLQIPIVGGHSATHVDTARSAFRRRSVAELAPRNLVR
jgi:hypothetical protein